MSSSRARSASSGYQSSQDAASRAAATSWSIRMSLVIGSPLSVPQLRRFMRTASSGMSTSAVWRSFSAWKVSTATGMGRPEE